MEIPTIAGVDNLSFSFLITAVLAEAVAPSETVVSSVRGPSAAAVGVIEIWAVGEASWEDLEAVEVSAADSGEPVAEVGVCDDVELVEVSVIESLDLHRLLTVLSDSSCACDLGPPQSPSMHSQRESWNPGELQRHAWLLSWQSTSAIFLDVHFTAQLGIKERKFGSISRGRNPPGRAVVNGTRQDIVKRMTNTNDDFGNEGDIT
jgi:hypothetical protein